MGCVLGSIYLGIATPTEAGGVGCFIVLVVAVTVFGLRLKGLYRAMLETALINAMILIILVGASFFSYVVGSSALAERLAALVQTLGISPIFVIISIMVALLILGCFIPPAAVILMVAPLLLPIVRGLGFDPIWFAVIMTVNLEIGLVTPPVGLNLYIVKNIAPDIPMSHVLLGVIPFVMIECIVILFVCIWPELALWLPNRMIGG